MRHNLREGMRPGDLDGLVLPMLSVDEYESKIDNAAVAIGFYVHDQSAADDLNRFLQKSPVALLSSEVSPAPDQHGFFLVFVELMPNEKIADNVQTLLKEIAPLCGVTHWKMRVRKTPTLQGFSTERFQALLRHARRTDEAILDFLTPSVLGNVIVRQNTVVLTARGVNRAYQVLGFGPLKEVAQRHGLANRSTGLSLHEVARCRRLAAVLGEGWAVTEMQGQILVQRADTDDCLLLGAC